MPITILSPPGLQSKALRVAGPGGNQGTTDEVTTKINSLILKILKSLKPDQTRAHTAPQNHDGTVTVP